MWQVMVSKWNQIDLGTGVRSPIETMVITTIDELDAYIQDNGLMVAQEYPQFKATVYGDAHGFLMVTVKEL